MVKEPRPGRAKTRLGRDIGMVPAAWWFRHQAGGLIRRLSADPRWRTALAVTPDAEGLASRVWPRHLPRLAQGRGDLGRRMARLLALPGPVVLVGADIPGITRAHVAAAFRALGTHEAVFGPAGDGGFWLVGLAGAPRAGLFAGVRWSSRHALADSLATLAGARVGFVATLDDVDGGADLRKSAPPRFCA
jgi:glycosyltransferase A (GT-A) superfamily protein (DUF2064 family)